MESAAVTSDSAAVGAPPAPTAGDASGPARSAVAVFGYAHPGIWGGEIADRKQAIAELGERLMNEAKGRAVARGVDLELEMISERPPLAAAAES